MAGHRKKIAIGLGANLGDRLNNLRGCVELLKRDLLTDPIVVSSVYESEPWGLKEQPLFLNAVMTGFVTHSPPELIRYFKAVEKQMGRIPTERNGPRIIDLDLLAMEEEVWETETAKVPHPQLSLRDFVVFPFFEVWPTWRHPVTGRTIDEIYQDVRTHSSGARKVAALLSDTENQ